MTLRPRLFEELGSHFADAFGNCDATFTIDGTPGQPVRIIARTVQVTNEGEEVGQGVETRIDSVSVPAASVPGLTSDRDSMTIDARAYLIRNIEDDGRAMLKLSLKGKLT